MLTALESRFRTELNAVRADVITGDTVRGLLDAWDTEQLRLVEAVAPPRVMWRVLDHCAALTRLYAVYERFLEDLAAEWLGFAPVLWPDYSQLTERVRRTHLQGVGRILNRLHYRRYRLINPVGLLDGLREGLSGSPTYSLEPRAFVDGERNYQPDVVREFFGAMGIDDIWLWAEGHAHVKELLANREQDSTMESALKTFVEYRNDAAHGVTDQVLGKEALLEQASILEVLGVAIVECVRDRLVAGLVAAGQAKAIGTITEVFPKAGAVVVECS